MATKNISIMSDVYELLVRKKEKNESFSDVIRRTVSKKKDIMEFAGVWKNIADKEIEEMENSINKLRKRSTKELLKRVK